MAITLPDTERLNILAVDDEAGSRTSLDFVLRMDGYHTTFARDGDEALDLMDHSPTPFDLIITDHQMVRLSGLDLVRKVREKGYHGTIVVLTAYAGSIEEAEYRKLEVAGVMEKPFDLNELRNWLGTIQEQCHHDDPTHPSKSIQLCWLKPTPKPSTPNPRAKPQL